MGHPILREYETKAPPNNYSEPKREFLRHAKDTGLIIAVEVTNGNPTTQHKKKQLNRAALYLHAASNVPTLKAGFSIRKEKQAEYQRGYVFNITYSNWKESDFLEAAATLQRENILTRKFLKIIDQAIDSDIPVAHLMYPNHDELAILKGNTNRKVYSDIQTYASMTASDRGQMLEEIAGNTLAKMYSGRVLRNSIWRGRKIGKRNFQQIDIAWTVPPKDAIYLIRSMRRDGFSVAPDENKTFKAEVRRLEHMMATTGTYK